MAAAVQISPHFYYPPLGSTAVSIEYLGAEYVLPWLDTTRNPKLQNPSDFESEVSIQHSNEEDRIWQASTFVTYGVYAQIRQLKSENDFPIVKIASRHTDARKHIHNEFRLLKLLSKSTSVVKIHSVPLVDSQGIFGLQMEKLDEMPRQARLDYMGQIRTAVMDVHNAGFAHCDLTFRNIMVQDHQVKLIDFGLSGTLGETIPDRHLLKEVFGH